MARPRVRVEALADHHDRRDFDCGTPALDRYLCDHAGRDERRDVAACFVLFDPSDPDRVVGYYTLSSHAIELAALPPQLVRRLPKYGLVPTVLLGRLAVDRRRQGQGIGAFLLHDAFGRVLRLRTEAGVWAIVVDAIDETTAAFYRRHDFEPLPADPRRLFMPIRRLMLLAGGHE